MTEAGRTWHLHRMWAVSQARVQAANNEQYQRPILRVCQGQICELKVDEENLTDSGTPSLLQL